MVCPFCKKRIKELYQIEQVIVKKRRRTKVKKKKVFIGYNYDDHKDHCSEYNKFKIL